MRREPLYRMMRVFAVVGTLFVGTVAAKAAGPAIIADLNLSRPFAARSPWHAVVTQGPDEPDSYALDDGKIPGRLTLCVRKAPAGPCDPAIITMPRPDWEAHYLDTAKLVYPLGRGAPPLLLVQTSSMHAGNGNQSVFTRLLAYRRTIDRFVPIFRHETGRNNNEEVRFVEAGPLRGSVITVEPTQDKPFGYWVEVSKVDAGETYRLVLRYRSATHYGDGNALAVIDSEMPNIQRRLGLWRQGTPLPLPARKCPKPHLVRTVLWCN
jgi:hypothetical protein